MGYAGKVHEDFLHFPLGQGTLTGETVWGSQFHFDDCVSNRQTERKKKTKRMRLATLCIILTHFYWVFVLSLPKLGHWNMSWLSFLAESVISDRPPCGRMPRPTGDPCSCKTAGSGPCLKETVHQRGCLASLHLSASSTTPPPYTAENLC